MAGYRRSFGLISCYRRSVAPYIGLGLQMNHLLWVHSLSKHSCPPWACPVCKAGEARLMAKSLTYQETVDSKRRDRDDYWDPNEIQFAFTAWAECSNQKCKQRFAIAGTGGIEPQYDHDGDTEWVEYFSPKLVFPMPDIIEFPAKCPLDIKDELRMAFRLIWQSPEACAGRLRVAVELLLDYIGVPKEKTSSNGKPMVMILHDRIETFAISNSITGPSMLALKTLGNAGSHIGTISRADILDALHIFEHALGEILDKRSEKVAALAEKLTKKHARKKA